MIILDTSLWVEHLRGGHDGVQDALLAGTVVAHPWVIGELALGGASSPTLGLLERLPQAQVAEPVELRELIRRANLANTGIGWVDAQLLASTLLTPGARLATVDRKLRTQAEALGISATV